MFEGVNILLKDQNISIDLSQTQVLIIERSLEVKKVSTFSFPQSLVTGRLSFWVRV